MYINKVKHSWREQQSDALGQIEWKQKVRTAALTLSSIGGGGGGRGPLPRLLRAHERMGIFCSTSRPDSKACAGVGEGELIKITHSLCHVTQSFSLSLTHRDVEQSAPQHRRADSGLPRQAVCEGRRHVS